MLYNIFISEIRRHITFPKSSCHLQVYNMPAQIFADCNIIHFFSSGLTQSTEFFLLFNTTKAPAT